ncbi:hypothetical protein [Campylobacter ureolyticus]|uniref:Uncharacterized protein n=2 Tax=Campylobacter ureolyticus TaxID=827 RepID=A0A9Q4PXK7_9BACT|nr:hypothetical protein [Campylobacter ureolyticus]MCZ6161935.1 hypothetical protein [Campylobacter ureolyticus]MCZ6170989.1 hypothetical protein [Campylobacter ureolyticus]MDU4981900.1 hypothetical protein [Campylobacter ureolyticus]
MKASFKNALNTLNSKSILIGITQKSDKRSDGMNNATLAMIHEFGSPKHNIAERSFLRVPLSQNQEQILSLAKEEICKALSSGTSVIRPLEEIGVFSSNLCKMAITDGLTPALKPATIKRKKSSKPLIDTSNLLNSITWEIRDNDKH